MAWARASPSSPRSVRQKKSPRKRPVLPSPSQSLREVIRFDIRLWWRLHYRWRFRGGESSGWLEQHAPGGHTHRAAEVVDQPPPVRQLLGAAPPGVGERLLCLPAEPRGLFAERVGGLHERAVQGGFGLRPREQEQPARDQLRQAEVERALADPQRQLLLAGVRAHLEQRAPEVGHREVGEEAVGAAESFVLREDRPGAEAAQIYVRGRVLAVLPQRGGEPLVVLLEAIRDQRSLGGDAVAGGAEQGGAGGVGRPPQEDAG